MKRLTLLFALFLCLCVFAGASETEAEEGDLILPSLADIGFPNAPDADKPRVIKADEFEGPDTGALVTNEEPAEISPQDIAQEKEQAAQALYKLGLFRGVSAASDGTPVFDLESVPTRNQAVIMLVRLLGKEDEALSGQWEIPFKDAPSGSATAPYIGYAYANGLTKGTSETTYSGTNPVTRNQYLLFLMRAMGYANHPYYSDEMSTADAAFVADKLGLLDSTDAGRFTRGIRRRFRRIWGGSLPQHYASPESISIRIVRRNAPEALRWYRCPRPMTRTSAGVDEASEARRECSFRASISSKTTSEKPPKRK